MSIHYVCYVRVMYGNGMNYLIDYNLLRRHRLTIYEAKTSTPKERYGLQDVYGNFRSTNRNQAQKTRRRRVATRETNEFFFYEILDNRNIVLSRTLCKKSGLYSKLIFM